MSPEGESLWLSTSGLRRIRFVRPDPDNKDGSYATPERAALSDPMRGDEDPRVVSLQVHDESHVDVEIDMGRHPADRVVYRCLSNQNGGWWAEGSSRWFDGKPDIVAVARPSEEVGLFIDAHRLGSYLGYQLVMTGYDFRSTHASEHASLEEAKAHASELTGLADLDWQPWSPRDHDS